MKDRMARHTLESSDLAIDVRARRRDLGLTQLDVADLAGVSDRFVMELEQGKTTVRLDKLTAVLDAIGLTLRVELRK
jgi:HTH-type transcriptional regulator/antitoxin HipB